MADRGPDRNGVRNIGGDAATAGKIADPKGTPSDVGRTSGGGSLGHEQPAEVEEDTNVRNNAGHRDGSGRHTS